MSKDIKSVPPVLAPASKQSDTAKPFTIPPNILANKFSAVSSTYGIKSTIIDVKNIDITEYIANLLPMNLKHIAAGIKLSGKYIILNGIIMSKNKISEAFNDKKVYIISFFRLIVIPLLIFFVAGRFVSDMAVLGVLVISFAMPVSGNGATFVGQYGGDVGFASRLTFVSTLLSLITMPFISLLLI